MNKNKLTALCLAALLCCTALAGCGTKPVEEGSPLPDGAITKPVTDEELDELIEQGIIPDPDKESQSLAPAPYTKGMVKDNLYSNPDSSLTLRIPAGWAAKEDYELCTLMGVTYNFEDPDANTAAISQRADIYDLIATDTTEDKSIMVLMQDLNQHGIGDMSAAEYLETMKGQFASENATYEISDITEVSYSGNEYSMMKVVATPKEGTEVTQYFFLREANGRMVTVMMTFPSADPVNPDNIFA